MKRRAFVKNLTITGGLGLVALSAPAILKGPRKAYADEDIPVGLLRFSLLAHGLMVKYFISQGLEGPAQRRGVPPATRHWTERLAGCSCS